MDTNEYLRGQSDCKNGLPHQPNQHPDYDRGFAIQYEWEQVLTQTTLKPGE